MDSRVLTIYGWSEVKLQQFYEFPVLNRIGNAQSGKSRVARDISKVLYYTDGRMDRYVYLLYNNQYNTYEIIIMSRLGKRYTKSEISTSYYVIV